MVRGRADGEIGMESEIPWYSNESSVSALFHIETGYFKSPRLNLLVDSEATLQWR